MQVDQQISTTSKKKKKKQQTNQAEAEAAIEPSSPRANQPDEDEDGEEEDEDDVPLPKLNLNKSTETKSKPKPRSGLNPKIPAELSKPIPRAGWIQALSSQTNVYDLTSLSIPTKSRFPRIQTNPTEDPFQRPYLPSGELSIINSIAQKHPHPEREKKYSSSKTDVEYHKLGDYYDGIQQVKDSVRRNFKRGLGNDLVKIASSSNYNLNKDLDDPRITGQFPQTYDSTFLVPSDCRARYPTLLDEFEVVRRKTKVDQEYFQYGTSRGTAFSSLLHTFPTVQHDMGEFEENRFGWGWIRYEEGESRELGLGGDRSSCLWTDQQFLQALC